MTVFFALRQRAVVALAAALVVAGAYAAIVYAAIDEAGVGDHCFH